MTRLSCRIFADFSTCEDFHGYKYPILGHDTGVMSMFSGFLDTIFGSCPCFGHDPDRLEYRSPPMRKSGTGFVYTSTTDDPNAFLMKMTREGGW